MSQDEKKDSMERIANALEEKNQITTDILQGILYGIIIIGIIFGSVTILLIFGSSIYGFFYYDIFGNERTYPSSADMAVTTSTPIDDCNYSEDGQLCYQMKRVADAIESQNKPTVKIDE